MASFVSTGIKQNLEFWAKKVKGVFRSNHEFVYPQIPVYRMEIANNIKNNNENMNKLEHYRDHRQSGFQVI